MTVISPAWGPTTATAASGPECAPASAPASKPIVHLPHSQAAHFGSWAFRHAASNPRIPRNLSKPRPARRPPTASAQPRSGDDSEESIQAPPTTHLARNAAARIEAADARQGGDGGEPSDSDGGRGRPRGHEEAPDWAATARNPKNDAPDRLPAARAHLAEGADTGRTRLRLAHVKQALIEGCAAPAAARKTAGAVAGNQYLLLPLALLNAARPRTAAQGEVARSRLALLARATIGGKK